MKMLIMFVIFAILSIAQFTIFFVVKPPVSRGMDYAPNSLDPKDLDIYAQPDKTTITIYKPNLFVMNTNCTYSMGSALNCNNTLVVEHITNESVIKVGDWISYNDTTRQIIHAVSGYNSQDKCYYFLGYNNNFMDGGCIPQSRMITRVVVPLPTSYPYSEKFIR